MKPQVRYARTSDGADIAFWAIGAGPALVLPPNLLSNVGLELNTALAPRYERLARNFLVVRYDGRTQGLSSPDAPITPESAATDLQAVVDALSLDRFALLARDCAGPIAIKYAAQRPDVVSHLVLWHAITRLADYFESPLVKTLEPMIDSDWYLYTKTMILAYAGWNKNKDPGSLADLFRASLNANAYKNLIAKADYFDAIASLASIAVPTLVLHRQNFDSISPSVSADISAHIPGSTLAIVRGRANALNDEAEDEGMKAIEDFLGAGTQIQSLEEKHAALSRREAQILSLLALGEHNREIAATLSLSVHTVERHVANIYAKIGARGRVEAAAYAMSRRLVQTPAGVSPPALQSS